MFLVLEGIDGSGKSTQARGLADRLRDSSRKDVLLVREPGGTPLGERVREWLLGAEGGDLSPETELFLFMAARSHLVRTVLLPAIERGRVVISDRFLWSSVVYQSVASGLSQDQILQMGSVAVDGLIVTRTFVIDVDPEVAYGRVKAPNRMEERGIEYQRKVREGFLTLAARFPETTAVIDGTGTPQEVLDRIWARLPREG